MNITDIRYMDKLGDTHQLSLYIKDRYVALLNNNYICYFPEQAKALWEELVGDCYHKIQGVHRIDRMSINKIDMLDIKSNIDFNL